MKGNHEQSSASLVDAVRRRQILRFCRWPQTGTSGLHRSVPQQYRCGNIQSGKPSISSSPACRFQHPALVKCHAAAAIRVGMSVTVKFFVSNGEYLTARSRGNHPKAGAYSGEMRQLPLPLLVSVRMIEPALVPWAHPCSTCPIIHPSVASYKLHQHTVGLNT